MNKTSSPAKRNTNKLVEEFGRFLQTRGKRMTQQRRRVVEYIFNHHEHFDAEELTEEVARRFGAHSISRPTVYRALAELVDAGLLRKMELSGRAVYEHGQGGPHHDHLHCQWCNKLIEFESGELHRIMDAVAGEHSFEATGHRLIITGICRECRNQRSGGNA